MVEKSFEKKFKGWRNKQIAEARTEISDEEMYALELSAAQWGCEQKKVNR